MGLLISVATWLLLLLVVVDSQVYNYLAGVI